MATNEHPLLLLLKPAAGRNVRWPAAAVIPLLALSATLVLAGAAAMPDGYSWLRHSISESAAQAQQGAWIARLSFVCFGAAVLVLALAARTRWARLACWTQLAFALSMFGAAAFSHAPWLAGVPADEFEDFLHSVFATGMGFAFCAGVAARLAQRGIEGFEGRTLDAIALLAAIVMPWVLASSPSAGGLVQRIMFAIAYLWFGREALFILGASREHNGS